MISLSLLDFTLDQPCWQPGTDEGDSYFAEQLDSFAIKSSRWLTVSWWLCCCSWLSHYHSLDDSEKWMCSTDWLTDWLTAVLYSAAGHPSCRSSQQAQLPAPVSAPAWYHHNNKITQQQLTLISFTITRLALSIKSGRVLLIITIIAQQLTSDLCLALTLSSRLWQLGYVILR